MIGKYYNTATPKSVTPDSPSSRLVHHHRHLVLLHLTDEGADHPAGLHGAVVPGGLPHLLPPGHGDVRARLLKLVFRTNSSVKPPL